MGISVDSGSQYVPPDDSVNDTTAKDAGNSVTQQVNVDGQVKGSGQQSKGVSHKDVEGIDAELVQKFADHVTSKLQARDDRLRGLDSSHPEIGSPPSRQEMDEILATGSSWFSGASISAMVVMTICTQALTELKKENTAVSAEMAIRQGNRSREDAKLSAEQSIKGAEELLDKATAAMVVGLIMGFAQFAMAGAQAKCYKEGVAGEKAAMDTPELKNLELKAGQSRLSADDTKRFHDNPVMETRADNTRVAKADTPSAEQVQAKEVQAKNDEAAFQKAKDDAKMEGKQAWDKSSMKSQLIGAVTAGLKSVTDALTQQLNAQGQSANQIAQANSQLLQNGAQDAQKVADSMSQTEKDQGDQMRQMIDAIFQAMAGYTNAVTQLLSKSA